MTTTPVDIIIDQVEDLTLDEINELLQRLEDIAIRKGREEEESDNEEGKPWRYSPEQDEREKFWKENGHPLIMK